MDNISLEQKALLFLLGQNLFGTPTHELPEVDWQSVIKEANAQAVFAIAFEHYAKLPLDPELAKKVRMSLMQHAMSSASCFQDHTYLHNFVVAHNIPYCAIKGAASAAYYPDPLLRSMGDVDFYVHPDDIERAKQAFVAEGFVLDDANHPAHIGMAKGSKRLEMHFKPVAYHEGKVGDIFLEYWQDIRESAILNDGDLATYRGPSTFHHGFILLAHLQHHLFHEGVGLRHFTDWAVFANSLSNEEFLSVFEERLKKIGLFRLAQLLSLGAVKHLGMAHKAWMGDDYETADELLADIIYGGNFGRKDRLRSYEGFFIAGRGEGISQRGRLVQLFYSLNNIVKYNWKWAEKCVLLYPIGWVYFSARYLIRVLLGKRPMNLRDTYQKSGKRKKMYSKLKVFVPEE